MKDFVLKWICLLVFFSLQKMYSQAVYKEVKAKIEVEKVENMLSVRGTVENLKSEYKSISYKLTVFKKNKTIQIVLRMLKMEELFWILNKKSSCPKHK